LGKERDAAQEGVALPFAPCLASPVWAYLIKKGEVWVCQSEPFINID